MNRELAMLLQFLADLKDYKAPHANRGTPAKRHKSRRGLPFKLFKGHRP